MRDVRAANWQARRSLYLSDRVGDQIQWYDGRAKYNAARATQIVWVSVSLQVLAILFAVYLGAIVLGLHHTPEARFLLGWIGPWSPEVQELDLVSVLTTIAASVVAWAQAKQHDDLQNSYRQAWRELESIRDQMLDPHRDTEADFQQAVVSAEGAISREHTMRAAKTSSLLLPEARWS